MIDVTADETIQRVIRSIRENNALLYAQRRAEQRARIMSNLVPGLFFVSGLTLGALPITDRVFAFIAKVTVALIGFKTWN